MRSQASKLTPKKGVSNKTLQSVNSPTKQVKKKNAAVKKVKNLIKKSIVKISKKKSVKRTTCTNKNETEQVANDNSNTGTETTQAGHSKSLSSRSESPTKKAQREPKEKKQTTKSKELKKDARKTLPKKIKQVSIRKPNVKKKDQSDEVKYKINLDPSKKSAKLKPTNSKSTSVNQKPKYKKNKNVENMESSEDSNNKKKVSDSSETKSQSSDITDRTSENTREDESSISYDSCSNQFSNSSKISMQTEAPKTDSDRPPKFFTTTRSPRNLDIDVKCCKISKGNLAVSERFLSMKSVESKPEISESEKSSTSSSLLNQGQDIDVYTFTDKVDSPKSILSDFRNPMSKNVGRVRPIARVKGTVIDKKTESEKKKYSPHRPIEEVVKQLKANKRSEELKSIHIPVKEKDSKSDTPVKETSEKDDEEKPKPIVSKSYKMVARKTSIPGKPFCPIKIFEQDTSNKNSKSTKSSKKPVHKPKTSKSSMSDEELDNSKFSFNFKSKALHYESSDESASDSNDENETKESSESDTQKSKKNVKAKKYKRITDCAKKHTSKELKELSKDSLVDLKDESIYSGKPSKRRLKLISMWCGPKKHRMASLNAIAKVHCLYENESRTHMELGLMKTVDRGPLQPGIVKPSTSKKKDSKQKEMNSDTQENSSGSEYDKTDRKEESSEDDSPPNTRTLRGVPGIRSAGKYWDPKSSTSSSEDSELESKKKVVVQDKKKVTTKSSKAESDKRPAKMKKTAGVPVKKKRNRNEVVMDLKDMVVQKRMASLNATAILAASYEKRSPKSNKDETTSDSCSDESFSSNSKNGVSSGVKSESKNEETKKEVDDTNSVDRKQKVEVIVNQDTDVTITGVYSTHHHEGFCTVSGMQYRISSTSHTQTTATANCEKEGCSREEEGARYTPLSALSSMQPPPNADHAHAHPHTVQEIGGLGRRVGCSSAFSAPSPSAHHEPGKTATPIPCSVCATAPQSALGYYQPAGPLIKETGADADRALTRYHPPPPHYHAPHPTVLQQYGPPYYPTDLCYGRYYRPTGPYHMPPPPQPDSQMVGVNSEPYPPPQYYGGPPCYQHSPQRVPYIEYRGCPCPMNACPKNVLIGPATGKAPTGGGPADVTSASAPPGGAFRPKVRAACAMETGADAHGSGKDPPLEPESPAAADAPRPCPLPAIGGASPKRELYDVRDNLRLAGDIPNSSEAVGPPSPARGSAGACAPQPPPVAPRRARLGKDMARRSLAGDDTGLLMATPQAPSSHSDADDDVLAISPPTCAPIDLSSSDETDRRSTPLVDVKKENEGPTNASPRKLDTLALREHNSTAVSTDFDHSNAAKAVKRRYSRPKLEIDMREVLLEETCKTNGIGEHVKLQKRRKVSSEQIDSVARSDTITKDIKKKNLSPKTRKSPKSYGVEKKSVKRKLMETVHDLQVKRLNLKKTPNEDCRLLNIAALPEDSKRTVALQAKTKSAMLLDNLLRKNSIDRAESNGFSPDKEINPAELFLPVNGNAHMTTKSGLNINNNVIDNSNSYISSRTNAITPVNHLIGRKSAVPKNIYQLQNVESKVSQKINTLKTDLKSLEKTISNDRGEIIKNQSSVASNSEKDTIKSTIENSRISTDSSKLKDDESLLTSIPNSENSNTVVNNKSSDNKLPNKVTICKTVQNKQCEDSVPKLVEPENNSSKNSKEIQERIDVQPWTNLSVQPCKELKGIESEQIPQDEKTIIENGQLDKLCSKRSKLVEKSSEKASEKVVKLLVSKKSVLKTDEAALLVEDACSSPSPAPKLAVRRTKRRRSGTKRPRRALTLLPPPAADNARAPRWSNGWQWDGEHYLSKVYLNNDSRLDRTARCWSRMSHASGDQVARGDCVLLRASSARAQPFVARVARLWENPEDGEMMVSLVWYYRPEHTESGRQPDDAPDEVFASRHRDANSVACIEDKCYVLTFNEYCRYRKKLKAAEEGIIIPPSIVPPMPASEINPAIATNDSKLPPSVSPELVLFCRKIYDFRSKKIQVPNK